MPGETKDGVGRSEAMTRLGKRSSELVRARVALGCPGESFRGRVRHFLKPAWKCRGSAAMHERRPEIGKAFHFFH